MIYSQKFGRQGAFFNVILMDAMGNGTRDLMARFPALIIVKNNPFPLIKIFHQWILAILSDFTVALIKIARESHGTTLQIRAHISR
jgi:hypothetical protein